MEHGLKVRPSGVYRPPEETNRMNRLNRDCYVVDFCTAHPGAEAVQVTALEGDHVKDIAEFRLSDWGPGRPDGVLEWVDAAPGDRLTLAALSRTGERCGGDDCWEQVDLMELSGDTLLQGGPRQ